MQKVAPPHTKGKTAPWREPSEAERKRLHAETSGDSLQTELFAAGPRGRAHRPQHRNRRRER
jgi:hypothetical protein